MVQKGKSASTESEPASSTSGRTASANVKKFDIAAELIRARKLVGLSQSELAEKSGVSRNTLMGYESGRNKPGARELRSICEVLKVTPNRLIFGREKPFEQTNPMEALGITDEHLENTIFPVMLSMLAREERDAVLTLIHNLLLARHGEEFRKGMDILRATMSSFKGQLFDDVEQFLLNNLGEEGLRKFGEEMADKFKGADGAKPKGKTPRR